MPRIHTVVGIQQIFYSVKRATEHQIWLPDSGHFIFAGTGYNPPTPGGGGGLQQWPNLDEQRGDHVVD